MPTRILWNERADGAPPATRRRALVIAALGLAAAVAACSGRDRARQQQVDADLGHDLDLASTTGIELANRGPGGTQIVSAIEETPRTSPRHSASPNPTSAGHRRHKVAKKPEIDAPPATVMVADHEITGAASTEQAAGRDSASSAPAPEAPNPGPAVTPDPQPYPSGGGGDGGRGRGGVGEGVIGVIGAILRGGMGGVDRCDERHGHGRRGGGVIIDFPSVPPPRDGGVPRHGGIAFPRR